MVTPSGSGDQATLASLAGKGVVSRARRLLRGLREATDPNLLGTHGKRLSGRLDSGEGQVARG
jgi:hypothetical protein